MGLPLTKEKNLKPQNVGSTPLSLVIFQCGIASHKRKKILNLKIWGLHMAQVTKKLMGTRDSRFESIFFIIVNVRVSLCAFQLTP